MAFNAVTNSGFDPAQLTRRIIKNGVTLNIGDNAKSYSTGYADVGVAGAPTLGVVIGFENAGGAQIRPDQVTKGTTAYPATVTQVVAAADNQTVAKQMAVICIDPNVTWSAAVNGTIDTTAASGLPGAGIDTDSANTSYGRVLETTATRTAGTITNWMTVGNANGTSVDPSDSTRLLVRLSASEQSSSKKG